MKKLLVLALAVMMVFAVAGNAAASFETGNAIAVFYAEDGNEVGIDLGVLVPGSSIDITAPDLTLFADPALTYDDINVGIFAAEAGYSNWFATTEPVEPAISTSSLVGFMSSAGGLYTQFSGADTDSDGIAVLTGNQYDTSMNSNGTAPGYYGGFNSVFQIGETALTADVLLAGVDMYLHNFDIADYDAAAMIEIDVKAVPIPAAAWLLGTGLLGLIGIRRRNG